MTTSCSDVAVLGGRVKVRKGLMLKHALIAILGIMKRGSSADVDAAMRAVDRTLAIWEQAKKNGTVIELKQGTTISNIQYKYRGPELEFVIETDGKTLFMPWWRDAKNIEDARKRDSQ